MSSWTWTPLEVRLSALQPPQPLPVIAAAPPSLAELPIGQKMALLLLRRGELANQILDHAREWGAQHIKADWHWLLQSNYAVRRKGKLELTPSGLHTAQTIARDLAKKLGIHSISYRNAIGNRGPAAECTCGFNCYSHRGHAGESNVRGQVFHHLRQVRDDTLPPAYRFEPRSDSAIRE